MTWFHYHNYGTALQTMAMVNKLKELGNEPYLVNYIPSGRKGELLPDLSIIAFISKVIKRIKNLCNSSECALYESKHKEELFEQFLKDVDLTRPCADMSELQSLNKKFDAFLCGSDQIWAPYVFDSHYYLDFVSENEKKIAYAPSIGTTNYKDKYTWERIKNLSSKFSHLSTREYRSSNMLSQLTGKKVETVLDPTLLFSADEWEKLLDIGETKEKPYLLAYFLGHNEKHWKQVYKIAKKLNLQVKVIPVFKADKERTGVIDSGVGPKEFVNLVKNATYVCTDSFHGVAFSVNFSRNFTVFKRFNKFDIANQNSRIYNILDCLHLRNRLFSQKHFKKYIYENIDYKAAHKYLGDEIKKSENFLKESLDVVSLFNKKGTEKKHHIWEYDHLCCGCGACSIVCPTAAIKVSCDENGFLKAKVDESKCISCGKCVSYCPFVSLKDIDKIKVGQLYSYKDNSEMVLSKSTSGGIGFRLAEVLVEKGYAVVGCMFDRKKQRARHIVIRNKNKDELAKIQGSKYIQSDLTEALREVYKLDIPIAVFGTPCQIAGAKRLLKGRENVLYVDLICHGIPSQNLYNKYIDYLRKKYNMNDENIETIFRYKKKGWREIYLYTSDGKRSTDRYKDKDCFFRMFEKGFCYMESCYDCKWRGGSEADIRLGDYWGPRFENDSTGVSMVLAMSEKGKKILEEIVTLGVGELKVQPIQDYYSWQSTSNTPKPMFYYNIINDLKDNCLSIKCIDKKYMRPYEIYKKRNIFIDKIKKFLKKILKR